MKNFLIMLCLLAGIATVSATGAELELRSDFRNRFPMLPPGAPVKYNPFQIDHANLDNPTHWALALQCDFNKRNHDLHCDWIAWATQAPISSQPIHKDFRFELLSEKKARETGFREAFISRNFAVIKTHDMMLPADYDRKARDGNHHVNFPMKVSCVRERGGDTVLWCERWMQDVKREADHMRSQYDDDL